MAELGQGQAPDPSKIKEGKCIISRNGSGASFGSMAIESAPPVGSASPAVANESSQSPSTYSNDDSPAPPPSTSSLVLNATGVVEKVIDGRKVIDFTDVPRPARLPRPSKRDQQPQYAYTLNSTTGTYELENVTSSQNMANAAMMYSQQMNYYYGMPMWPGAPGAAGYPAWPTAGAPGVGLTPPPPPPPPDNQPPPPPPPPPK